MNLELLAIKVNKSQKLTRDEGVGNNRQNHQSPMTKALSYNPDIFISTQKVSTARHLPCLSIPN
ncbi:hypothetical protein [Anabaena azotica]|uniref:hypothetical protein n=1 Tax=Anabaena azotica TaxID=197653 RepID=UPI0039A64F90